MTENTILGNCQKVPFAIMVVGSSLPNFENMKKDLCKHHGLPKVSGIFCEKCCESLKAQQEQLNKFFNSPRVVKAINEVLNK